MVVLAVVGSRSRDKPSRQRPLLFIDLFPGKGPRIEQNTAFCQFYISRVRFMDEFPRFIAVESFRTVEISGADGKLLSRNRSDPLFQQAGVPAAERVT